MLHKEYSEKPGIFYVNSKIVTSIQEISFILHILDTLFQKDYSLVKVLTVFGK